MNNEAKERFVRQYHEERKRRREREDELSSRDRFSTDFEDLKRSHRFLFDEDDEASLMHAKKKNANVKTKREDGEDERPESERMSKKYDEKLYKEYAIVELKPDKKGVGLRFRTEKEVKAGKGEYVCASKNCEKRKHLVRLELNFRYKEHDEMKNALVKVVVCQKCEIRLQRMRQRNR